MGPTWGPPGSCCPQVGPILAPLTCYQGKYLENHICASSTEMLIVQMINVCMNYIFITIITMCYFAKSCWAYDKFTNYMLSCDDYWSCTECLTVFKENLRLCNLMQFISLFRYIGRIKNNTRTSTGIIQNKKFNSFCVQGNTAHILQVMYIKQALNFSMDWEIHL